MPLCRATSRGIVSCRVVWCRTIRPHTHAPTHPPTYACAHAAQVMSGVVRLLGHHSPSLLESLRGRGVDVGVWAWRMMRTLFTEVRIHGMHACTCMHAPCTNCGVRGVRGVHACVRACVRGCVREYPMQCSVCACMHTTAHIRALKHANTRREGRSAYGTSEQSRMTYHGQCACKLHTHVPARTCTYTPSRQRLACMRAHTHTCLRIHACMRMHLSSLMPVTFICLI
jgi:hypothetical protein